METRDAIMYQRADTTFGMVVWERNWYPTLDELSPVDARFTQFTRLSLLQIEALKTKTKNEVDQFIKSYVIW